MNCKQNGFNLHEEACRMLSSSATSPRTWAGINMYCAGPASGTHKMLGHKHFLMPYLQQSPLLGIVTSRLLYPHKMKGNV
jgi:hypothetical protein